MNLLVLLCVMAWAQDPSVEPDQKDVPAKEQEPAQKDGPASKGDPASKDDPSQKQDPAKKEPAEPEAKTDEPAGSEAKTDEPAEPEAKTDEPAESEAKTDEPAGPEAEADELAKPGAETDEPAESEAKTAAPVEPAAQPKPIPAAVDERPESVEADAKKKIYTSKSGDTFERIAADLGFLPSELEDWNSTVARDGDKIQPGQKITYWAVVDEGEKPDKPGEPRTGLSPFVGVQLGPAFSFSALKTAVHPRFEGGVELPLMDRMLRVFVSLAYARPASTGGAKDAEHLPGTTDGAWSYDLKQSEVQIAFGPTLRLPALDLPIIPEASIGPDIYVLSSVINGKAGSARFPESREKYVQLGLYFAVGAALEAGPGEATLHLQLSGAGFKDTAKPGDPGRRTITGKSSTTAFSPAIGYRLVF